jgi:hypothetical protein
VTKQKKMRKIQREKIIYDSPGEWTWTFASKKKTKKRPRDKKKANQSQDKKKRKKTALHVKVHVLKIKKQQKIAQLPCGRGGSSGVGEGSGTD